MGETVTLKDLLMILKKRLWIILILTLLSVICEKSSETKDGTLNEQKE